MERQGARKHETGKEQPNHGQRFLSMAWVAVFACLVDLIPLVAMRFSPEVNWDFVDFVAMWVLLFIAGGTFVFVARRVPRRFWVAVGVGVAIAFLYVWAELAVGIFTNLGN